jgi:hypothetical protein
LIFFVLKSWDMETFSLHFFYWSWSLHVNVMAFFFIILFYFQVKFKSRSLMFLLFPFSIQCVFSFNEDDCYIHKLFVTILINITSVCMLHICGKFHNNLAFSTFSHWHCVLYSCIIFEHNNLQLENPNSVFTMHLHLQLKWK